MVRLLILRYSTQRKMKRRTNTKHNGATLKTGFTMCYTATGAYSLPLSESILLAEPTKEEIW